MARPAVFPFPPRVEEAVRSHGRRVPVSGRDEDDALGSQRPAHQLRNFLSHGVSVSQLAMLTVSPRVEAALVTLGKGQGVTVASDAGPNRVRSLKQLFWHNRLTVFKEGLFCNLSVVEEATYAKKMKE